MPVKELNFITGNPNKLAEVKAILGDTVLLTSKSLDLPEIQGTIEEIALDKCRRAAVIVGNPSQSARYNRERRSYEAKFIAKVGGPVLIEDTALCFNALKGLPGPYIKWFLESLGHEGLNKLLFAYEDKSAQAVCTFAYCGEPGHDPIIFEGRASGIIVPARGPPRFGWDAIFEYGGETYAEMEPSKKNGLSHRYLALKKMKDWFLDRIE